MLYRVGYLCLGAAMTCFPVVAQIAEPIFAKSAVPFLPGSGSVKLDYVGGIGSSGVNSQVIPQTTLEAGGFEGLEFLAKFPLLRASPSLGAPAVIAGGQTTIGARYLLLGGAKRSYALSIQGVVESPTGDSQLVGNSLHLTPTLLGEWRPTGQIVIYSNLAFDRPIGGIGPKSAFFEYAHAVGWEIATHLVPLFELVGSTNTFNGRIQLVGQTELILRSGPHWEFKGGLALGLNSQTAHLGLHAQAAWFWGRRE
jgi:hypothetical protein